MEETPYVHRRPRRSCLATWPCGHAKSFACTHNDLSSPKRTAASFTSSNLRSYQKYFDKILHRPPVAILQTVFSATPIKMVVSLRAKPALLHKSHDGFTCESIVVAGGHEQTHTPRLQDQELARVQRSAEAPRCADDLVRSRHDLGSCTDGQARPTAGLQRCGDPDLPDDEGVVRHGAPPDDRVRREPAAADRPGLGGARLQHPQPPPENPQGQHPISRISRPAAPADRQHRDQGRGRR